MPITLNVNVKKVDKDRLYKGKKGLYLNLTLWETEGESAEYGDYICKQSGEKGEKMPILGNAKVWDPQESKSKRAKHRRPDRDEEDDEQDDEIPF